MTSCSGCASSRVREDFLEEVALELDQGKRDRRHILRRERPVQVSEAGAHLVCSDAEGDRGQAGAREGSGVRAEGRRAGRSRHAVCRPLRHVAPKPRAQA